MTPDETDARPVGTYDSASGVPSVRTASALSVTLLALSFVGAATAGVLGSVGPYLVGISALVAGLLALSRR